MMPHKVRISSDTKNRMVILLLQTRLRMSSVALQRWMMSVLCLVVMWLAMNMIAWLTYDPSLIDLANFFLPLMLLPLISSAYAEVNQEGLRLLKVGYVSREF